MARVPVSLFAPDPTRAINSRGYAVDMGQSNREAPAATLTAMRSSLVPLFLVPMALVPLSLYR